MAERRYLVAKPADLVIAAAAEAAGLVVLHYDDDYERIAAVTNQATERVASRDPWATDSGAGVRNEVLAESPPLPKFPCDDSAANPAVAPEQGEASSLGPVKSPRRGKGWRRTVAWLAEVPSGKAAPRIRSRSGADRC